MIFVRPYYERPPVLRDRFCWAEGVVVQDRLYCSVFSFTRFTATTVPSNSIKDCLKLEISRSNYSGILKICYGKIGESVWFLTFLLLQAKSQFKRRSTANNVEIIIPVPMDADTPKFKTTTGSCKYAPDLNAVVWTIKSFPVN